MPHEIYKRGKIWHYRGTVAGRRLRGSCGTSEKATAQRIAAQVEAKQWRIHLDGPEAHVTFAQAAISYRNAEKATRFLSMIEDHWKDTLIKEMTPGGIKQSAIDLHPNATGATRNRQVIVPTCPIINHAASLGWCDSIKAKRFDVEAKTKDYATSEWVNAFAAQAVKDNLPHLAALCFFMYGTAARLGEAIRLQWADVDAQNKTARLYGWKPKPWSRNPHLPSVVMAALEKIPSNRNPDESVFQYAEGGSVKQVWDNVIKRAGIKRLTPHSCRHGFATAALRKNVDVVTVAKLGGWKDAATVLKYYAHAREDRTLSDVVFDTELTQPETVTLTTNGKQRIKKK